MKKAKDKIKEFFATSWAIDNKTSIYVMVFLIALLGIKSYISIPKEQFPEIIIPTVMVTTIYPGTSPTDIENLVTRPIEKQLKSLTGVKKVTSSSQQDFSSVVVEFNTDLAVSEAKQKVRDAVDKAKSQLPSDLPKDPDIMEVDFSEIPIMYIQLSGNYDLEKLRKFAEVAQDRIESLKEITRVDLTGGLEREIQINVDMYKMQAAGVTMSDVERAIASENRTISAGDFSTYGMKRSIRLSGEFEKASDIEDIVLKSTTGALVYVKDIAEVVDGFKEQESFSRLNGKNVITLNVIKRSGQNLIDASDQIKDILDKELKVNSFPKDLDVTITGDMSRYTKNTLEELNNTIIIGFILVIMVLMFFMGFTNSFFVGLSVPLSMFVAYLIMPGLGFTMNMIVMFGFIFALGIVVDDAIVVIENTHRIHKDEPDIVKAAKRAAGEVFVPILSGTLTTLAPFFPLAFWPGIVGKFMYYMPVTLILTLFASLFVAYVINPVFAVSFMKHEYDQPQTTGANKRKLIRWLIFLVGPAIVFYIIGWIGIGNLLVFAYLMILFYDFVLVHLIKAFQEKFWPKIMRLYEKSLRKVLRGSMPWKFFGGIVLLLIVTFVLVAIRKPKVIFFPDNQPNTVNVFVKMPVGTDQRTTDSITKVVENRVNEVLGKNNPIVESVISNVAAGAGEGNFFDRSSASHRGKVAVNFVEYKKRKGEKTAPYLNKIRDAVKTVPGAQISVEKNRMGPPTGKPINIEISGEEMEPIIVTAEAFLKHLDSMQIAGIDELKSDFVDNKPEILIDIDRVRANHEGLSQGQIGMELRNAIYGKEISKFKENEDEYPIMLRYSEAQRKNINQVLDMKITYRDMATGQVRQIPLASVAKIDYTNTYGGISRKNFKRVITIYSDVVQGYNANEIVTKIKKEAIKFPHPSGVEINLTGESDDQKEAAGFLSTAMLIALGLIFFILITQFNSISKSLIILSEVIFSVIGVLLGIVIFNLDISIIMTGLGVVALGGIVVRNGILIVEFIDVLKLRGMKTREAIVQAGLTRVTPVVLTATATMLGLVPLAIGLNIDFISLFTHFNPHLHLGGDNVAFWGLLSWTIIFGLSFATFLTLLFVPAMYLIAYKMKVRVKRNKSNRIYRKSLAKA